MPYLQTASAWLHSSTKGIYAPPSARLVPIRRDGVWGMSQCQHMHNIKVGATPGRFHIVMKCVQGVAVMPCNMELPREEASMPIQCLRLLNISPDTLLLPWKPDCAYSRVLRQREPSGAPGGSAGGVWQPLKMGAGEGPECPEQTAHAGR